MRETHVVTCFVTNAEGRLLILRRSGRVGTYRGRWAGVSGYLETSPEEQAYTELAEELGLDRREVALRATGEPLEVADADLNRRWVVHPFLFSLEDPSRIRLDWENVEARWIAPSELESYETVPGLAQALARVSGRRPGSPEGEE